MNWEKQYLTLLEELLLSGNEKGDRTGTGTRSLFHRLIRVDLQQEFPLMTTKRIPFKAVAGELLWMLSGSTSAKELREKFGTTIWDEWQDERGELGPVYGAQWRDWSGIDGQGNMGHIDQIADLIHNLKTRQNSRRHVVSAWNVIDLPDESVSPQENVANGRMALSPCHCLFQFYVSDGKLSCALYQRSCDIFLGVPFNIASYALLTHIIAKIVGLDVGEFIWTGGDVHLYNNHVGQAEEQLSRTPNGSRPKLIWNRTPAHIDDVQVSDFEVLGYYPLAAIKAPVAI
jgi:thymidylate synthase